MPTAVRPAAAADATFVAPDACPVGWPALHAGPPTDAFDGNVSVLVGGDLTVTGAAAGAEGVVVTRGQATFALDAPGTYELGVTPSGSQVAPYAGSDMLTVGGALAAAPGTRLDVGRGLGGDVVVGDGVAEGTEADLHGGRLDAGFPDAISPYDGLLAELPSKAAGYASLAVTGTVEVTDTVVTLIGDGASDPQVFSVDGAALGAIGRAGRSLTVVGVPGGATAVVNLTGPAVDLDVDALVSADGTPVDPFADPSFADLATHLLWNAPTATTVEVGGLAQLPGTLLVPSAPSTTTVSGAGTNGRVLVAGDLVHTGTGALHSYPFQPDPELACTAPLVHRGTLTLDVDLQDPDHVVDADRVFQGRFACTLDGRDVTPADDTWQVRATAGPKVLSDAIPVGAACSVSEQLQADAPDGYEWAEPVVSSDRVKVAKREPHGVTVLNRVRALPPAPTASVVPIPEPAPTQPVRPEPEPVAPSGPTSPLPEPTQRPAPTAVPTSSATEQVPSSEPDAAEHADSRRLPEPDAPLTAAPLTLRGTFVWGPMLLLSVLTLLVRARRRPRRLP